MLDACIVCPVVGCCLLETEGTWCVCVCTRLRSCTVSAAGRQAGWCRDVRTAARFSSAGLALVGHCSPVLITAHLHGPRY